MQIFSLDIEDFINPESLDALETLLKKLRRLSIKGILFITGDVVSEISKRPRLMDLMKNHVIGYHSSSHSARPTIPEYTDIPSYNNAKKISALRETHQINHSTGEIGPTGGLCTVQEAFPEQKIQCFRAPGLCWSPPHLEALRDLGIRYDFSTRFPKSPCKIRRIIFYPFLCFLHEIPIKWMARFLLATSRRGFTIIADHPDRIPFSGPWDEFLINRQNPQRPARRGIISRLERWARIDLVTLSFHALSSTIETGFDGSLDLTPSTRDNTALDMEKIYDQSVFWARQELRYEPRYLRSHFEHFFRISSAAPYISTADEPDNAKSMQHTGGRWPWAR